jgi:Secretory lipase
MLIKKLHTILSRTLFLFLVCIPMPGWSVAMLTESFELHIPWINYQDQTYAAVLKTETGNTQAFQLITTTKRESADQQNMPASAGNDLNIHIPLVSYQGELYSATMDSAGNGNFQLTDAQPVRLSDGRGAVLSITHTETRTAGQIRSNYPFAVLAGVEMRFDVAIYTITYQTLDAFGNITPASGVIGVPVGIQTGAPLLSFQHGTIIHRDHAPSVNSAETGADIALFLMGASGYLTLVPDYLGFGANDGLHPFMHAKTLAWSVIDLIRAVQSLASENHYPLNNQLFLAGYSEGGFATMATQREIETFHADEFTITASAPMGGAYDLSGTMLQQFLSGEPLPRPFYFPYLLIAYNTIYGFSDDITTLLNAALAGEALALFDGQHDSDTINAALPVLPRDLVTTGFLAALESDAFHPVKAALENNDVYRWKPVSPMRLYHCAGDDRIPYANATTAHDFFIAIGADVSLQTLLLNSHADCAIPALLNGKTWFDSLADLP